MPEITQLTCRSTENLGNLSKLTRLKYKQTAHTDILPKIIELRSESRERSGNLPKITQLRHGSTDRSGYLPLMEQVQSQNDKTISVHFQGKPFNITVIQVYAPTTNTEEAEVEWFFDGLQDLLDLKPKNRCPFHHRGLECKSKKSRDTCHKRQVWP